MAPLLQRPFGRASELAARRSVRRPAPATRRSRGRERSVLAPRRRARPQSACVSSSPASTTVPPGASALAKSGASSISGPARMLATIRSNGARAASSGESIPSACASSSSPAPCPSFTPLIAALSRATSIATRVDVGRDALRLRPQRQRGEGEQAGAGADVGDIGEARALAFEPVERVEAAAGGRVLAGAEGEARVDFERDRARRDARGTSACGRRSGRRGSAGGPAWLIVTQSASPSCSIRGSPDAERRAASRAPRRWAHARNRHGSASRRAWTASGSSATSTGGFAEPEQLVRVGDRFPLRARAGDRDPAAHLAPASFASRSSSCLVSAAA